MGEQSSQEEMQMGAMQIRHIVDSRTGALIRGHAVPIMGAMQAQSEM